MPARLLRLTSAACLLLTACAGGEGNPRAVDERTDRSAAPAPAVTNSALPDSVAPEGSSPNAWTAGIARGEHDVAGAVVLTDVRVGQNEGFDRIVLEFIGEELPSYHVGYVDPPIRACGSGEIVEVAGDGWLLVRLDPADAHDDRGQTTIDDRRIRPGLPVLGEVRIICDFEARVEFVVGVAAPNLFRVMELSEPARLVVDVLH